MHQTQTPTAPALLPVRTPTTTPSTSRLSRPRKISSEEIVERCFYALVNEGFRCLEEGIAEHPDDIDVVWAYGYAWPGWRGGPMFWADEIGARTLVRQMVSENETAVVHVCVQTHRYTEYSAVLKYFDIFELLLFLCGESVHPRGV